ncbi:MAG: hypothetical protein K8L97_15000 [Anaerolineae bacterium]|nr:hypothetical protein [Anaerolineae bacterium]
MSEDDFLHKLREKPRSDFAHELYQRISEEDEMIEPTVITSSGFALHERYARRRSRSHYGLTLMAAVLALIVLGGLVVVVNRPQRSQPESLGQVLEGLQPITPENAGQLQLISEMGNGYIGDLAWSVDGSQLAVSGMKGVWVYESDNAEAEPRLLQTDSGFLPSTAYSPDGTLLAATDRNSIRLWDAKTGELKSVLSSDYLVNNLTFSPDSKLLLTGETEGPTAEDTHYFVRLWDVERGEMINLLGQGQGSVNYLTFSPDGTQAAAQIHGTGFRGTIVWDTASGEQQRVFQNTGQDNDVSGVAFNPVDSRLALPNDTGATLWDSKTGEKLGEINIPAAGGLSLNPAQLQFSPDGNLLAISSRNLGLFLWDMEAEVFLPKSTTQKLLRWVNSIVFSPDGQKIAAISSGEQVHIWDVASSDEVRTIDGFVGSIQVLQLLPDDLTVVTRTASGDFHIFDLAAAQEIQHFATGGSSFLGQNSDVSPDGSTIAYSGWEEGVLQYNAVSIDMGLRLLDLENGETSEVDLIPPGEDANSNLYARNFSSLDYSPDGKWLVGVGTNSSVELFDVSSGTPVFDRIILDDLNKGVWSAVFSPDSQSVAVSMQSRPQDATAKTLVMLIDLETGETRELLDLPEESYIPQIEFSPDGKQIAVAVSNGVIELVDVESGEVVHVFVKDNPSHRYFQMVAFSPDSRLLAASGGEFSLWDVSSGEKLFEIADEYPAASIIKMSSDGRFIVVAGWDGFVQVWGVLEG